MKIWLAKNSEISVREQLQTQISLGIVSGDLSVGEKLPSTGELARRFKIHANTVSNVYHALAEKGVIEFRQGSGFYVCEPPPESFEREYLLEKLLSEFIGKARDGGFTDIEIKQSVRQRFADKNPQIIKIIEPDKHLRDIIVEEIRQTVGDFEVEGILLGDFDEKTHGANSILMALLDEKPRIERHLPAQVDCFYLKANSAAGSLTGKTRPAENDLIAIISGWERFLLMAKTMLIAADIPPECLLVRSTDERNWRKGLENVSMIICDSLTAKNLPNLDNVRHFPLIADESIQTLKKLCL